ncbi:MAG: hypothetical protein Q7U71_06495, partial [bacterium]|nr:hypothetical protein [bacterium]
MKKVLLLVMFIGFSNILYAQSTYFEVQGGIWLDPATIVKTIEFNKLTECNFVEGKLNYCYSGPTYNCSQAPYLRIEKWGVKYIVNPLNGSISTQYLTLLSAEIVTFSKFPALKMLYGTLDDLYFTSVINDISYRITLYDDGIYSDEKGRPWIVFYSEVPENTTKADAYTHNSTKYIIPRIMLNDAIINTNKKLFERAAFFADYFTSNYDANKPDNYSTTTSTGWFCEELGIPVTSMEHFMDPISHRGYGPLNLAGLEVFPRYKSAGNKCQEYYNTALTEYANGNIDIAVQHLTWGLHFVQDACIPLHDDPVWGTADEDVVEAKNRAKWYHKPAEDALCGMINSPLFSNYRYEGGKYEIADPHGSGVTAFSWVDANAHKFYDLRPLSDNVLFPPADDIMVVANEVAPYFWATSTGFVNYFCDNVSGCPIGAKNDIAYPPYHFSKEPGPSDANEITFIWSDCANAQAFRLYFWPYNQLPILSNIQMIQIPQEYWPSMPIYTITTANGLPIDWINYRFAITTINNWGVETEFSRTYCYQDVCPANFYGTVMNSSQVKLQWTDNNDNEDAFLVWCSTDPNIFPEQPAIIVDPLPGIYGMGECIVPGLAQGQIYYFMIKARRPTDLTNCATTEVNMAEPGIPTIRCEIMSGGPGGWEAGFRGPVVTANTEPNMNAGTTTTIEIERKTGANGLWQLISQESIFTRSGNIYLDEVAFNQDYWYRARAVNGIAASVYTPECNITRYQLYLKAPTITDVTTDGHSILVEWCDSTRSEYMDGYRIYWKKATETMWNSISSYDNGYTNNDYIWGPLERLTTYQVKMARYYYKPAPEGVETEQSPIIAVMIPITGVTGWNSSRHLVRTNDKKLAGTFYTDNLVKCCQSKNNGLSWDISEQIFQATTNSAVATAPTGKIYTFRSFEGELFIDSLIPGESTIEYCGTEKVPNAYGTSVCQPAIAIDERGRLHCLWTAYVNFTNYLYYAKRENGTWSMPSEIYGKSLPPLWDMYYVSPTVVVSASGDIHIAWSSTTTDGMGCPYSVILYSINLGAPIILAGSDLNNVKNPILAISNNGIIALSWQQGNYDPISGQENMEIYRRVKNGENWNTPYNVSNNTGASQMPAVSYDNEGTLHLLWSDNSTTGFTQAVYPSYEPAKSPGISIDNAVLGNEEALIWSNQKATDDDKTVSIMPTEEEITIIDPPIDPTQIFYRRYKNNSWSPIYRLTASAAPSIYPSLPLTDDAAQMGFLWTEGSGVKYKRLPDLDAPTVVVTYPNGGEMLYSGRRYNITWSSADNRGLKEYVLYYTTNYLTQDDPTAIDAVTLWRPVATVPGNLNSYSWRVPYNVASTVCRFKIVAYDSSGNTATDISDKSFTIRSRDIAVVTTDKAIAYNNAGKIARSSDGLLHVCYNGIDSVYYMASSDDGQTW